MALMDLAVATYSTAALAFAALTFVLAWRRSEVESYRSMILAAACTTLWAAATALLAWSGGGHLTIADHLLEVVRSTAWLVFLGDALTGSSTGRGRARRYIQAAVILSGSTVAAIGALPAFAPALARSFDANLVFIGYLALAILGLALTENLFRNVPSDARWNLKFLCFGIGALFGYDFFLYSQALLFRQIDVDLFAARGITNALSVPLLIVSLQRSERAGRSFIISHRLAFHSAALLGTGLYLLLMAAAGYYIRQYGGSWGGVLQTVFLFGTVVVLIISLSSGTVRGYLKTFVGKHFFKYKYDYREEWLRFIRTISEAEQNVQLPERVIQAVCDIVDSPEGGLWLLQQDRYQLKLAWNLSRWELRGHDAHIARESPLIELLTRTESIVDVDVMRRDPGRYPGLELPAWLEAINRTWLIIPLIHHDELRGVMILGQPRAPKALDWEDYDLLRTVGQQAASYLAEYELSEALADARQFEAFNKRFAFVIHDIKNLVSRLSLIVSNAAKHRHDAAFQDDVIRTIEGSVEKMKRLLLQLHGQPGPGQMIEFEKLVRSAIAAQSGRGPAIGFEVRTPALMVKADEEHLRRVVGHLLQNAAEAAGPDGKIQVRLRTEGPMAVLEVEDDGPGMDPDFVRDKLFKPFKTTKGEGYGIGAYETQEFARASGGRLDVFSQPGRGTIMKMSLPLVRTAAP